MELPCKLFCATAFQSSTPTPMTMNTAKSWFVQLSTRGIVPPGATGNAVCFALAGEHESPTAAGVSRVDRLVTSWSTENKERLPSLFELDSQIAEMTR